MEKLNKLVNEFFTILDTVEETDGGREFHPVQISSCRVLTTKRLGEIFAEMKDIIKYEDEEGIEPYCICVGCGKEYYGMRGCPYCGCNAC